jgi:hypothetical protein
LVGAHGFFRPVYTVAPPFHATVKTFETQRKGGSRGFEDFEF